MVVLKLGLGRLKYEDEVLVKFAFLKLELTTFYWKCHSHYSTYKPTEYMDFEKSVALLTCQT